MNRILRARIIRLEGDALRAKAAESIDLDSRPQITAEEWMWIYNPKQAAIEHAAGQLPMVEPNAAHGAWCQRHGLWPNQTSQLD